MWWLEQRWTMGCATFQLTLSGAKLVKWRVLCGPRKKFSSVIGQTKRNRRSIHNGCNTLNMWRSSCLRTPNGKADLAPLCRGETANVMRWMQQLDNYRSLVDNCINQIPLKMLVQGFLSNFLLQYGTPNSQVVIDREVLRLHSVVPRHWKGFGLCMK